MSNRTDFGMILQRAPVVLETSDIAIIWVQHPLAMLGTVASDVPEIAELLADMQDLQVVLCPDEFTPGQQINSTDGTSQFVYWSLADVGQELLCFGS